MVFSDKNIGFFLNKNIVNSGLPYWGFLPAPMVQAILDASKMK